jgi:hypothetical protein
MAGFHTKTFQIHDDYTTPKSSWEAIADYIPRDKVIWEAFYADGKSGTFLQELGYNVIHEPVDFFESDLGEVLCSNPPFSKTKEVMERLLVLDKPFIMILPASKISTSYMRAWKDKGLQIIIPRKRIHFTKLVNGVVPENYKSLCNFDCFYYCYKIDLPHSIIWLD